jgi:transcriptional regulator with XRE-family HTH domain
MADQPNPRWRGFGAELKRMRTNAGLTQLRLGSVANVSGSLISAIEKGTRPPKRTHAEHLDTALSTGGTLTRLWLDINKTLDVPDWWRDNGQLERRAIEIREYISTLIPGLLQTEAYARTAMAAGRPWDTRTAIDHDVTVRLRRRSEFQHSPLLWFVVDEYALTRIVGSKELMLEQLDSLVKAIEDEEIRFQLITQPAPHHPGMSGQFRILSYGDRGPVALVEHLLGEEVIESSEKVRQCQLLYGALQGEALSLTESARMVRKIREDFAS